MAGEITVLLSRWREGSAGAEDELFRLIMPDLRRLARYFLRRERDDHSLQSTDLVNTAYLRLVTAKDRDWQNRRHFFAIAGRVMRRYLIDQARARPKVGFTPLDSLAECLRAGTQPDLDSLIAIGEMLDELERIEMDLVSIVELKVFLGMTNQETADALGLSLRTFQRKWHDARRWMYERLEAKNVRQHDES